MVITILDNRYDAMLRVFILLLFIGVSWPCWYNISIKISVYDKQEEFMTGNY